MLNEVIVSQAALNGIRVITTAVMVVLVLLGLGGAGLFVSFRMNAASRLRLVVGAVSKGLLALGLLLAAGIVVLIGVATWEARPKPMRWDLDLTGRASLQPFQTIRKCSEWKIGETINVNCIFEGVITLSARFSRGRRVEESGHALWAAGLGDDLASLHLFLSPMSQAELEGKLAPLFADWDIPLTRLVEWKSEATSRRRYFTTREEQRDLPWLEVSISGLDTPPDASRPWVATLKWHWIPRARTNP